MAPGLIGGPLGCLGVAMLLAGAVPRVRVAGLVLIGAGCSLLGAQVVPDQHRAAVALGIAAAVAASAPLALAFKHRPWLLAFAILPSIPVRVPLTLGGTTFQLWLPMYVLACAAGIQIVMETLAGDRRVKELGPIAIPLAGFVFWTGLSITWTDDLRAGSLELLAYVLPFSVLAVAVARLCWSRRAIALLLIEMIGLASIFAGVGIYQYATRNLFWNPKVIVDNAYLPFYRVNSVFFDPSMYGRFLMVSIVVGLVVLVRGVPGRLAVALAVLLPLIWLGLLLSYSQSSFAGLIVAIVLLMAVVWRRVAIISAGLVAVVLISTGAANPTIQKAINKRSSAALNRATSDRAGLIYNGIRIAIDHPIAGVGVGGFRRNYAELTHLKGKEPLKAVSHDSPVTVAAEDGVIGLALFGWVLVATFLALGRGGGDPFQRRLRLAVALSLAAIGVHSLFNAHFLEDPTTWCLLGLTGLCLAAESVRGPAEPGGGRAADPQRHPALELGRVGAGQAG